jgi:hypothetical protein
MNTVEEALDALTFRADQMKWSVNQFAYEGPVELPAGALEIYRHERDAFARHVNADGLVTRKKCEYLVQVAEHRVRRGNDGPLNPYGSTDRLFVVFSCRDESLVEPSVSAYISLLADSCRAKALLDAIKRSINGEAAVVSRFLAYLDPEEELDPLASLEDGQ